MQVTAEYFESNLPGAHPLVIVLPLWGTYTYPPQKIAEGIRDRGSRDTHVLRVLGERYLFDWDELASSPGSGNVQGARRAQMSERMRVTVIDVRRHPRLGASSGPRSTGIASACVGFSMSAVVPAACVRGSDDRVRSAALVMGGADLHDIIANCNGPFRGVCAKRCWPASAGRRSSTTAVVEDTWSWLESDPVSRADRCTGAC